MFYLLYPVGPWCPWIRAVDMAWARTEIRALVGPDPGRVWVEVWAGSWSGWDHGLGQIHCCYPWVALSGLRASSASNHFIIKGCQINIILYFISLNIIIQINLINPQRRLSGKSGTSTNSFWIKNFLHFQ